MTVTIAIDDRLIKDFLKDRELQNEEGVSCWPDGKDAILQAKMGNREKMEAIKRLG